MLDNNDKNEIMKMLASLKREILKEIASQNNNRFADNQQTQSNVENTETAICELDETSDSRMADIENALCELDEE